MKNVPVVILCGGYGTRLSEETKILHKSMVKIGNMPIIWHILKIYSAQGFNNFILVLGDRGEQIKEFFINYNGIYRDSVLTLKNNSLDFINGDSENWNITFLSTGKDTNKGSRIKMAERFISTDYFMCTYGDGLSSVDFDSLISSHIKSAKLCTITAINKESQFGQIEVGPDNNVSFIEKPVDHFLINGGFFVFDKRIFEYLHLNNCDLEKEALPILAKQGQINLFKHNGFWQCMDTYKDKEYLERLWNTNASAWKTW